jgi:hypothetical protein
VRACVGAVSHDPFSGPCDVGLLDDPRTACHPNSRQYKGAIASPVPGDFREDGRHTYISKHAGVTVWSGFVPEEFTRYS